jgi:tetratricopeptide (TPR) repeat protein
MNADQLAARLSRNPRSPLFARLASSRLDAGLTEEALLLCEGGLAEHPQYSTAHLIVAKCHADVRDYRKALDALSVAEALSNGSRVLSELRTRWEEIAKEQEEAALRQSTYTPPFRKKTTLEYLRPKIAAEHAQVPGTEKPVIEPVDRTQAVEPAGKDESAGPRETIGTVGPPEPLQSVVDAVNDILAGEAPFDLPLTTETSESLEPLHAPEAPPQADTAPVIEPPETREEFPGIPEGPPSIPVAVTETPIVAFTEEPEENVPSLPAVSVSSSTLDISSETVAPVEDLPAGVTDQGRIVSKTLAEIYAAQGAYGEAILTYKLLRRVRPELVPQIDRRIGELESLSGGK